MITYKNEFKTPLNKPLKVLLMGKIVGEIRTVNGGFQYFPKDQKTGGDIFKTVELVKRSLEEE